MRGEIVESAAPRRVARGRIFRDMAGDDDILSD